jgi:hypothetical protein
MKDEFNTDQKLLIWLTNLLGIGLFLWAIIFIAVYGLFPWAIIFLAVYGAIKLIDRLCK